MAGVEIALRSTGLTGSDDDGHRMYTTVWRVRMSSRNDGPRAALAYLQANKPATVRGSYYQYGSESDVWAFCKKVPTVAYVDAEKSRRVWDITVEHDTKPGKRCAEENIDDPLSIPPVINGSFVVFTRPAGEDKDGNFIENTAHQAFEPAPEVEDHQDTLHYAVNTATIDLALRAQFRGSVNSTPIWGLPARCVKIMQWNYSEAHYGECYKYVQNQLEFSIRDASRPFVFEPRNLGTFQLNDDGVPIPIVYKDEPVVPVVLGTNGKRLVPADAEWNGGQGISLSFPIEKEIDYHLLPVLDPLPGPYV